eukprot:jgi/Mesvir1/25857/Mv18502-RA.1
MDEEAQNILSTFIKEANLPPPQPKLQTGPTAANPANRHQYIVKMGDTWESIASAAGVQVTELIAKNIHVHPRYLSPGDVLIIPQEMTSEDFARIILNQGNKVSVSRAQEPHRQRGAEAQSSLGATTGHRDVDGAVEAVVVYRMVAGSTNFTSFTVCSIVP